MAFLLSNGAEVNFPSNSTKDISPRNGSVYRTWVEPFGIDTHYSVPIRYVTGDSSAGSQTAWITKKLYYYPVSSQKLTTTSSTTTNQTKEVKRSFNYSSVEKPSELYTNPLSEAGYLDLYITGVNIDSSNAATFYVRKTVGPIIDSFPQFYAEGAVSSSSTSGTIHAKKITEAATTFSEWAGGRNSTAPDIWFQEWYNYTADDNQDIRYTNLTTTNVYNIPIIDGTTLTTSIKEITFTVQINLVELFHGDQITYGLNPSINIKNSSEARYLLSSGKSYSVTLSDEEPTKTFTITPTFYKNSSSAYVSGKAVTIKASLSGTSISLEITQPYALCGLNNIQYTWCGYSETIDVSQISYKYQTTTTYTTTTVNGNLIQYNNTLHRCYFASPTDEVGDYYGTMKCYSLWVPASDDSFYAGLSNKSCVGLVFSDISYSRKTDQSASYLNNRYYVNYTPSQISSHSNYRSLINNNHVFYLNPFYNHGSTLAEFLSYYNSYTKLYSEFQFDADIAQLNSSSSITAGSSSCYKIETQYNTCYIISKDTYATIKSFPVVTYHITFYPLRYYGNTVYNISDRDQTLSSLFKSDANGSNKYTITYLNTSGTQTIIYGVPSSVTIPSGGYLSITASGNETIRYSSYTTSSSRTTYLTYYYNGTYDKTNSSFTKQSGQLSYSFSATARAACIAVYCYCYNTLTYSNEWGTSTSYGNSLDSSYTSYTSSNVSNLSSNPISSSVTGSTIYFKLKATIDNTSGRYNHRYRLYRKYYEVGASSSWSIISIGSWVNPKYSTNQIISYTDWWNPSTAQRTYYYYIGEETQEISYPTITTVTDAGNWRRSITIYNPNSFTVTAYYTASKCTSYGVVDSGANWTATSISSYGTSTVSISDRGGFSDAYIIVGIATGSGCYCCSSYSESPTSAPVQIGTCYLSV